MTITPTGTTTTLYCVAGALCVVGVVGVASTPGEGANIGAGGAIVLAMVTGLVAAVRTVQHERMVATGGSVIRLGRTTLTWAVAGSAAACVLSAAAGQWPLAAVALVPTAVCATYALRRRPA